MLCACCFKGGVRSGERNRDGKKGEKFISGGVLVWLKPLIQVKSEIVCFLLIFESNYEKTWDKMGCQEIPVLELQKVHNLH